MPCRVPGHQLQTQLGHVPRAVGRTRAPTRALSDLLSAAVVCRGARPASDTQRSVVVCRTPDFRERALASRVGHLGRRSPAGGGEEFSVRLPAWPVTAPLPAGARARQRPPATRSQCPLAVASQSRPLQPLLHRRPSEPRAITSNCRRLGARRGNRNTWPSRS